MKICIISNLYPPYVLGGAEIIVEKLAKGLAKKNNEVIVITSSPDNTEHTEIRDSVKIYYLNKTRLYPVYHQTNVNGLLKPLWHVFDLWNNNIKKSIKKIVTKEKCDIIHINNFKGLSLSCFSVGRDLNIPTVFESHDFSLICPRANLIKANNTLCTNRNIICDNYVKIQRKLLNDYVDLMISPSQFMIEKYKNNNFFNNTNCVKIPLGIDFESKKSLKTYDTIDITYIGSLGKHKGVSTLITAFKKIKNSNIKLHLIGKGYDEEEFKQLAKNDDRITFHGFVKNENINEFYELSNIIVVPSICYDNSPLVIYESLTTGTPIIGSDIGGIPELIKDGVNGLLFEPENDDDLNKKLLKLINDIELLKQMEDNAFNSIPNNSIDNMIEQTINEYEKLLNKMVG